METRPIGIFDSGVGGLSVAQVIHRLLPAEPLVYIGDTARAPYGTKSPQQVLEYSQQIVRALLQQNVKVIVIACNSITATCLNQLQALTNTPIIGVIQPSIEFLAQTTAGSIGVLATPMTIQSQIYQQKLLTLNPDLKIWSQACPEFVPLIESGQANSPQALQAVKKALSACPAHIDTLHLGCTHYVALKPLIAQVVGPRVTMTDTATPTTAAVAQFLQQTSQQATLPSTPPQIYFSQLSSQTISVGSQMFGQDISALAQHIALASSESSPAHPDNLVGLSEALG